MAINRNNVLVASILTFAAIRIVHAQPALPDFSAAVFSNPLSINNPYYPLVPGTVSTFNVEQTDPDTGEMLFETIIVEVLSETRNVAGVNARVVHDRVFQNGLLREDTFDWYAQDNAGNVWYLGENVTDYEYDSSGHVIGISHPGMWEAGVGGAKPGYVMLANPTLGQHYYQEFYPGTAVDEAKVTGVNLSFTVPLGSFNAGVLKTRDTTALEPDNYANKYYAPGVGPIAERGFLVAGNTPTAKVDRN